jgi:HAUS augmin-like complex subunit 2
MAATISQSDAKTSKWSAFPDSESGATPTMYTEMLHSIHDGINMYDDSVLDHMRQVAKLRDQQRSRALELDARTQDAATEDLTSTHSMKRHTSHLNDYTQHMQHVIAHKSVLLAHLQQPQTGKSIVVKPEHQEQLQQVLTRVAEDLCNAESYKQGAAWIATLPEQHDKLEQLLETLHISLGTYHRFKEALDQVSDALKEMQTSATATVASS